MPGNVATLQFSQQTSSNQLKKTYLLKVIKYVRFVQNINLQRVLSDNKDKIKSLYMDDNVKTLVIV